MSNVPLSALCVYSIKAAVVKKSGRTLPLHVGQEVPQPLPDPVALTIAPARIDNMEKLTLSELGHLNG